MLATMIEGKGARVHNRNQLLANVLEELKNYFQLFKFLLENCKIDNVNLFLFGFNRQQSPTKLPVVI